MKNIFDSDELELGSVVRKFRITAADGKSYSTKHYNLDAVISVGYRINSVRATQFRQWATQVLREILQDAGKVTATLAKTHAESEFEKYRIVQDRLFESDFDRVFKQLQQKDGEIKDR
ncbi:MAG: RhuM family protein [Pseudomonadota bacterium]|nr:RhuM family protein [Pseudomonadota bacterium]